MFRNPIRDLGQKPILVLALLLVLQLVGKAQSLEKFSEKLASAGLGKETKFITKEQEELVERLSKIHADEDELEGIEREILNKFDASWPRDKLELKRIFALRLRNAIHTQQALDHLTRLTQAQSAGEQTKDARR